MFARFEHRFSLKKSTLLIKNRSLENENYKKLEMEIKNLAKWIRDLWQRQQKKKKISVLLIPGLVIVVCSRKDLRRLRFQGRQCSSPLLLKKEVH